MNTETQYQCSACGYPVLSTSVGCPHCKTSFGSSVGSIATGTFGWMEMTMTFMVGIMAGFIFSGVIKESPERLQRKIYK